MFSPTLGAKKAYACREYSKPAHDDSWNICGQMCAVSTMKRTVGGKDIRQVE
jgi:thiamine biosynthesis protein ThiC